MRHAAIDIVTLVISLCISSCNSRVYVLYVGVVTVSPTSRLVRCRRSGTHLQGTWFPLLNLGLRSRVKIVFRLFIVGLSAEPWSLCQLNMRVYDSIVKLRLRIDNSCYPEYRYLIPCSREAPALTSTRVSCLEKFPG